MNAHAAAVQALYGPTAQELAAQLPSIALSLSESLDALAKEPTAARAGMALIQVHGLAAFVAKLRELAIRDSAQ